jgi:hypothetical protein
MDIISTILGGFGLSAPAGLNAWLTLLFVGLAGRFNWIKLSSPFDLLSNTWVLVVLGVLLLIEMFVDKIPAVDTINDGIQTFIRPVAGGVLFAGSTGAVTGMDRVFAFILGLLSAGGVHAAKMASRPVITATTGGIGNPIVSFLEDFLALGATALAIFAPIVAGVIMLLLLVLAIVAIRRLRARFRRRRQAQI